MNFQTANTTRTTTRVAIQKRTVDPRPNSRGCIQATLFRERVDPFRQREIQLGEATLAVSGKNQPHFVVTDIDVGMMFLLLSYFGHGVYEVDRTRKIIKLESSFDVLLLQL